MTEEKRSQFHDSEYDEFFYSLNFDNLAVDDDYINYLDDTIWTYRISTDT